MCGLFGFSNYSGEKIKNISDLTNSLAEQSAVRGTDATGIAFCSGGNVNILKESKSAYRLNFKLSDDTTNNSITYDTTDSYSAYSSPNNENDDDDDDDEYYNNEDNFTGREKIGKPKGKTPGNNQAQNKQFDDATKGLDYDQKDIVHRKFSHKGAGYHEIREFAKMLIK